jgi:hypothetical protein
MSHLDHEELILHYYGESAAGTAVEQHLEACRECRAAYGALQRVFNMVDAAPVPERSPAYGAEVWERLRVPRRGRLARWFRVGVRPWAAGAAMAALAAAAFLAGRFSLPPPAPPSAAPPPGQVRERILLVAVGDYLERSRMVLVELANAEPNGALNISAEQERAAELVSENRLYRQAAARTGETAVAGVLDELERVLLEIARGPSRLSRAELESIRQRMEAAGILFKVRVIESSVREREEGGRPARSEL